MATDRGDGVERLCLSQSGYGSGTKGEMLSSWTVTGEVVLHCALMGGEDYFPQRLRAFENKS